MRASDLLLVQCMHAVGCLVRRHQPLRTFESTESFLWVCQRAAIVMRVPTFLIMQQDTNAVDQRLFNACLWCAHDHQGAVKHYMRL